MIIIRLKHEMHVINDSHYTVLSIVIRSCHVLQPFISASPFSSGELIILDVMCNNVMEQLPDTIC